MKIKFIPHNIEVDVDPNSSLLDIAKKEGIVIQSSCNGMCSCGDCRVFLQEGGSNTLPPSSKELDLIGATHSVDQRRLACQVYSFGNLVVDLTEQKDRLERGKISQQFLDKARKKTIDDVHSADGILIQDDEDMKSMVSKKPSSSDSK